MRTFDQLTEDEQQRAEDKCVEQLLEQIIGGGLRFSDEKNQDDLQARIDAAGEKANEMQTPWFAHEYIMEAAGEEIRGMGRCDAEDAVYAEPDEHVIEGIIEHKSEPVR